MEKYYISLSKYEEINIAGGLKNVWKPEDYLFNSKIKDISDNFRIEVNYKSKASKLFEVELSFNQKGQMFVQKRKTKRLEKLQNTNSEYITAQNNYSSLSDEINTLNSDLADKKKNYEEFTTSQNGLEKINDENDKLEKEKEELQNMVNTKQSTLDSLNNRVSSTSQSTLTLTSGTYTVGENIKAGKYTIMGSGSIAISSSGKARVNSNLTADGKDYVLNDDETIKIKGKAQFIPIK